MSNSANQLGGKCPYMPYLGREQMSGGGTCPTLGLDIILRLIFVTFFAI